MLTVNSLRGEKNSLEQALGQTAEWFKRALAVEPVKGNLRLSGYSACGQDGGVQLPHEYVEGRAAVFSKCWISFLQYSSYHLFSALFFVHYTNLLTIRRWCCWCGSSSFCNH